MGTDKLPSGRNFWQLSEPFLCDESIPHVMTCKKYLGGKLPIAPISLITSQYAEIGRYSSSSQIAYKKPVVTGSICEHP